MSSSVSHHPSSPPREASVGRGFVEETLLRLFTRRAFVSRVEEVGTHFRLIDLKGSALRDQVWLPGQKVQVQLGGWVQRTYTPMSWDSATGSTRLMVYLHGRGPGTAWADKLMAGDACALFGPRNSVHVGRAAAPLVFFGDETSIGLASALHSASSRADMVCLLEVHSAAESREALRVAGLTNTVLLERASDESQLLVAQDHLKRLADSAPRAHFVLTGRAQSIQRVGQGLKRLGVPASRITSRAYWAVGKTGLE